MLFVYKFQMILYDDSSIWTCVHVSKDLQEPQFISITGKHDSEGRQNQ